ncbi:hypothetical protein GDO81_012519 [Engystomops pustulosus]|uniref:Uncharacterized protein n=1 Tax=Engystomops pustulosus TaxID=76066 RepID=A0AAV7BM55_ENGPU|nr:hypothetical protein GDO81_012519 [Engystomops pustulosus]
MVDFLLAEGIAGSNGSYVILEGHGVMDIRSQEQIGGCGMTKSPSLPLITSCTYAPIMHHNSSHSFQCGDHLGRTPSPCVITLPCK